MMDRFLDYLESTTPEERLSAGPIPAEILDSIDHHYTISDSPHHQPVARASGPRLLHQLRPEGDG